MSPKSRNIEDTYPLSPLQEGMLFHSLYAPESGVYITQVTCTLEHLHVAALEHAWQQVVERHPILRTAFVWRRLDKPLQVVGRKAGVPLEQQDWRGLSATAQEERFQAYLQTDRRRGFTLSSAPLMRLALFQVAKGTYRFVWSHHHILLDGWSVHWLIKEVFTFYRAFCQGQQARLQPSRPYRDYIAWLQQQDMSEAERFWRRTLQGFTTPTPLGVDREPGSVTGQEEGSGEQRVRLSRATTTALRLLARQQQLTLSTLVQGAWALLLSRYSGEDDVVFGTVVSGRPGDLAEVESMVGLFINTLPVRVHASPEAALLPWLQQLQEQQAEMRRYEYSPLVKVQEWSDVPRGRSLFESIYVFENYPVAAPGSEPGVSLDVRDYRVVERENYPLAVVAGLGTELTLKILYDCRRFDAATITRLLGHLQTLLQGMVAQPGQRVGALSLVTAAERQTLLVTWNATATAYPQEEGLAALFEGQVAQRPDAIAVVYGDAQL
ncbi:MAG TPA: condensation domain-containing protein, partial [Candidatus Tectomicrobia bacterium]